MGRNASRVHRIVSNPSHAQIDCRAQHATQAINELKVLDDSTEAVTADLGVESLNDHLDVVAAERLIQLVVLQALQGHDRRDLAVCDELATQVEQSAEIGKR